MNWYLDAWIRYTQFSVRASREAFWMFMLVNLLFIVLLIWMKIIFHVPNIVDGIYSLLLFLPTLSLIIRRLHDTDRSGWRVLVTFLPVIGIVVFIYFLAMPSDEEINRFNSVNMRGVL